MFGIQSILTGDMHEILKSYFKEFTRSSEEKLDALSPYFNTKTVKKNEFLLREGEVCKFVYFVVTGCLRFYSLNEDGAENTRYFAFERKFGTSFTSLITGKPSHEYIQCLEHSTVLVINKVDFFYLVEHEPSVNKVYRHILESAYITTQRRIYDLQGADSLSRLKWLVDQQPQVFTRISSKVIASYLGVTPYTLSRLRKSLNR